MFRRRLKLAGGEAAGREEVDPEDTPQDAGPDTPQDAGPERGESGDEDVAALLHVLDRQRAGKQVPDLFLIEKRSSTGVLGACIVWAWLRAPKLWRWSSEFRS